MKPSNPSFRDWMDAHVEAYLDGDLAVDERADFEHGLAAGSDWEAELFLAGQIRDGLRALPRPACPPRVTEAVLAQVRREVHATWKDQFRNRLQQQLGALWQPALAMTVLLLLVVSAALIGRPAQPQDTFAEAQVQQALVEVQWALGYLSEVSRETGKVVRDEVIADRVVSPVQQALTARSHRSNDMQP